MGHAYFEGVIKNGNIHPDDAFQMQGYTTLSPVQGEFSFARCEALKIHGTNKVFNPAVPIVSVSRSGTLTTVTFASSVIVSVNQVVSIWGFTGPNKEKLEGTYKANANQTGTVIVLKYYGSGTNEMVPTDSTGGFGSTMGTATAPHGDCWQIDSYYSYTKNLSLDYCTGESNYQGIICGANANDQRGNHNLEITRFNLRDFPDGPWPRDWNAFLLYVGGPTGNRDRTYDNGLLEEVYVRPRAPWSGGTFPIQTWAMYPQAGTTRPNGSSGVFANGGGWSWPVNTVNLKNAAGTAGVVFEGDPPDGDFSRVTGTRSGGAPAVPTTLDLPGKNYVGNLKNYAVVPAAANPVMSITPVSASGNGGAGTLVGIINCTNLFQFYRIILSLTVNPSNYFRLRGRRLELNTVVPAGTYNITLGSVLQDCLGEPTGNTNSQSFSVTVS
jgi:hypothetical protein